MKTIGIIANREKDKGLEYTKILADSITEMGGKVRMLSVLDEVSDGACNAEAAYPEDTDMVICLGGDGTFLKAARKVYRQSLPILGINLGNLGFLAEVDKDGIKDAVKHLFEGNYSIEERMMLEMAVLRDGRQTAADVALNDAVITRGAISRILHVKLYINGVFADSFPGDGLIVSSPTGSTAYSLSAGGPIVEPGTDLMVITPICPHILYSRSFITMAESRIRATVDEDYRHSAMVTVDGQEGYELKGGDSVEVWKSRYKIKMVKINSTNFFNILRSKIYYRGESLKKDEIRQACKNTGAD